MIDLETMATNDKGSDAAIVSIGAVLFDPRLGKVDVENTFYRELDWLEQGRRCCPDTMRWWDSQDAKAKSALEGIDDLVEVLEELSEFLPPDAKVWGNGPTFDISILEDAYRQHDLQIPWKFWNIRDFRTVKDMYESQRGGLSKGMTGVKHNALDDAIDQAQYINYMWSKILRYEDGK